MLEEKIYNSEVIESLNKLTEEQKIKAFLSGYKRCPYFYVCDYRCSTYILEYEEFASIFKLMKKHNLSSKDFMNLYVTYLKKGIHPYTKSDVDGEFIKSMNSVFSKFVCEHPCREYKLDYFHENDTIGEESLAKLIKSGECKSVDEFCEKYNLDKLDFITLAKIYLHSSQWYNVHFGQSDNLFPDLKQTLNDSLGKRKVERIKKYALKKREKGEIKKL